MPVYKGMPTQVDLALLNSFAQYSDKVFANTLLCVGKYWAAQNCVEQVDSRGRTVKGSCVDEFINDFYGSKTSRKLEAWCVHFVTYMINEASRATNCANKFPQGTKTYANAATTLALSQKFGSGLTVNQTPALGSIFYRYSGDPQASGHMGLVMYVDSTKFMGLEGNIKVNGETEGVGLWMYDIAEAKSTSTGFKFIHTEDTPCTAKSATYRGINCFQHIIDAEEKAKQELIAKQEAEKKAEEAKKSQETDKKAEESSKNTDESTKKEDYTKKEESTVRASECLEYIIKIPDGSRLLHWSNLQNPAVAGDITGANFGRPGAVFGYMDKPKDKTGFGIMTDNAKNLHFIFNMRNSKSQFLFDSKFMGLKYCLVEFAVKKEVDKGAGSAEKKADLLMGKRRFFVVESGIQAAIKGGLLTSSEAEYLFGQYSQQARLPNGTLFDMMLRIEQLSSTRTDKKFSFPFVFMFRKVDINAWKHTLTQVLSIVASIVPVIPGLSNAFPPEMIKNLTSTVDGVNSLIIKGGTMNFVQAFAQTAQFMLPETTKGVTDYAQKVGGQVGEYLGTARNAFDDYWKNNISSAAGKIGIEIKELEKIWNKYTNPLPVNLTHILKGEKLSNVSRRVSNIGKLVLVKQIGQFAESGLLQQQITSYGVSQSPIMQDLLLSGQADTILTATPKFKEIVEALVTTGEQSYYDNIGRATNSSELHGNLIKAMMGFIPEKTAFRDWTLTALYAQASKARDAGIPYVIPPEVYTNADEAYCFKIEVERQTDATVIACPPGYEYNPSSKACERENAQYGYDGGNKEKDVFGKTEDLTKKTTENYDNNTGGGGNNTGGGGNNTGGGGNNTGGGGNNTGGGGNNTGGGGNNTGGGSSSSGGGSSSSGGGSSSSGGGSSFNWDFNKGNSSTDLVYKEYGDEGGGKLQKESGGGGGSTELKKVTSDLPPCIEVDAQGKYWFVPRIIREQQAKLNVVAPTVNAQAKTFAEAQTQNQIMQSPFETKLDTSTPIFYAETVAQPKTNYSAVQNNQTMAKAAVITPLNANPQNVVTPSSPVTPLPVLPLNPILSATPFGTPPMSPAPTSISPTGLLTVPGIQPPAMPLAPGSGNVIQPYPIGLSDEIVEKLRAYKDAGTGKWYANYNGTIHEIDPVKCELIIEVEPEPEEEFPKLPPCIQLIDSKYWYVAQGKKYKAAVNISNGAWLAEIDGQWYDMDNNCQIVYEEPEPFVPTIPNIPPPNKVWEPEPEPKPYPQPEPKPYPQPEPKPYPQPEPKPYPQPEPKPYPQPEPKPYPQPEPKPYPQPEPKPFPDPVPPPPSTVTQWSPTYEPGLEPCDDCEKKKLPAMIVYEYPPSGTVNVPFVGMNQSQSQHQSQSQSQEQYHGTHAPCNCCGSTECDCDC